MSTSGIVALSIDPASLGPVWAVAVAQVEGRPVIITGGDDGTVRRWDAATGAPIGDALTGHTGWVRAVAVAQVEGRPVIITGGGDGTVRRWDAATGAPIGDALTGHTGEVRAVAVAQVEGRPVIITGGRDGTVRRWDAATGAPIGDALTGHTGPVEAVAVAQVEGRPVIITGGDDGTVRRWDAATGAPIGDALTGHTGPVEAVAVAQVEGRPVIITGGDDGTVRRWDAATGAPIGDALTGHTGPVEAVAVAQVEGRPVIITGGDDGTVRVWDFSTGAAIAAVRATRGAVTCLDVEAGDAPRRLASGGTDGTVVIWRLETLARAAPVGLEEAFTGENTGTVDHLTRGGLAAHLAQRLRQLTGGERSPSPAAGDLTGSAIVHVDGRWGAGKTTLIERLLEDHVGAMGGPIVVRYDAWRQAAIAPEWWSVASEVRRAVRRSRAVPVRVLMTCAEIARRLGRSTSTWVALLVAAAAAGTGRWLVDKPTGIAGQVDAVLTTLSALSGILAVVFVLSRGLFWTAPVMGRLHLRTDDNPLAEISGIVGQLRRWTPREAAPQRFIDWVLTLWVGGTATMAAQWRPITSYWNGLNGSHRALVVQGASAGVLAVSAALLARHRASLIRLVALVPDAWRESHARSRPATRQYILKSPRAVVRDLIESLRHLLPEVAATLLLAVSIWLLRPVWGLIPFWQDRLDPTTRIWVNWAAAGVIIYVTLGLVLLRRPRRMVLLVIDDLDRCDADRVVRLLETVHTVLRERSAPRFWRRWRHPAPLGVIVLASGRWIRDAFSTHYATFDRKATEETVHDLGADFLQKVFDHSVLVPALSPEQTEGLIHAVSRSRFHAPPPPARRGPQHLGPTSLALDSDHEAPSAELPLQRADAVSARRQRVETSGRPAGAPPATASADADAAPPDDPAQATTVTSTGPASRQASAGQPAPPVPASTGDPVAGDPAGTTAPAGTRSALDDLGVNAQLLVTHLLTDYSKILPGNPRLVIRVAAAWAMLRAVARSLNLEADAEPANEVLVRAAVIWVRFPVLVDELLDTDRPPITDPTDADCPPRWRRRDVQQVMTMQSGQRLDPRDLALYYGKFFAPAVPAPPAQAAAPLQVVLLDPAPPG